MILTGSKQWELIGVTSFSKVNRTSQSGSGYILIAPFVQFIRTHIHKSPIVSTIGNCSCQCPGGFDLGYANGTINSLDECLVSCMETFSNSCIDSTTYACFGTNCTYSKLYNFPGQSSLGM